MKTVTVMMSAAQTATYDAGESAEWRDVAAELRRQMDAKGAAGDCTVECYTADGTLVWAVEYERHDVE